MASEFGFRGMEFSDTWQHSGSCGFSPDGALMAIAMGEKLIIRSVASLDVSQIDTRFVDQ